MANVLNYWWITRPKRKLNSIPEILGAFSSVALNMRWDGNRNLHISFEDELERCGLKRVGARRDHGGSGGRTYQSWLSSLGLIFIQAGTGIPFLTLAGEAIMAGRSPVDVLKNQVLNYQFPSPHSIKTHVAEKFRIHPFIFLLRLMNDSRIGHLTEEEIAKIVITEAVDETDKTYEHVIDRLNIFRSFGDAALSPDFLQTYAPSTGKCNPKTPFLHLTDTANTMVNWLEYTRLICRDKNSQGKGIIRINPDSAAEVEEILNRKSTFIRNPEDHELFQRRFGLDPWHKKDLRNLLNTKTVTSAAIDRERIRQAFIAHSIHNPVVNVDAAVVNAIAERTGTDMGFVEEVLSSEYPCGAIGGFMTGYYEMAFKGREQAIDFEMATTSIFRDVLGFEARHLGQTGSVSAPDILLVSDSDDYQAIIDTKAYSSYSISGDHHNRMVHNYIEGLGNYSSKKCPIAFFSYIAGGFAKNIDRQLQEEVTASKTNGSCISVSNMIKLVEKHQERQYSHAELRKIFGLNRQVLLEDFAG